MYDSILDVPIGKWTTSRPKCSNMSHTWKKYDVHDGEHPNVASIGKNLTIICMVCRRCGVPKIKIVERNGSGSLVNLMVLYYVGKIK